MQTMVVTIAGSVWLLGLSLGQQAAEVPGAVYLTAAASGLAVIAIAQAVRSISRTEAQKTQVVEALQEQLAEAHDEIHRLLEMLREREE